MAGAVAQPTERQVQRAILEMCGQLFPDVYIHHSPNGAYLGSNPRDRAIRGGALKGDGTKAGFPDLICLWDGGAAFLEVKRPKGSTVSDDQKASHERLRSINWPVAIVKSREEAHAFLKAAGAPCRGELM
jgi:hypothetical protein